jgi:hypothetical protein
MVANAEMKINIVNPGLGKLSGVLGALALVKQALPES